MKAILIALGAAATLAAATATSSGASLVDGVVADAIVGKGGTEVRSAYMAAPDPGYVVYSGYAAALPGPGCYWTRMPVYGPDRNVIGWRGRPMAVCP
jgi:hypothetical protein